MSHRQRMFMADYVDKANAAIVDHFARHGYPAPADYVKANRVLRHNPVVQFIAAAAVVANPNHAPTLAFACALLDIDPGPMPDAADVKPWLGPVPKCAGCGKPLNECDGAATCRGFVP